MDAEDVKKLLTERPFKPLRLHLSDGSQVEIIQPELATLYRFKLVVNIRGHDPVIMEDDIHVSLMHIVKAEHLKGRHKTNGKRG